MNIRQTDLRNMGWMLLRWSCAVLFVYAGLMKIGDNASFAASIARFQIVPEFVISPMALSLPPLEILCGVTLLVGPWKRQAAFGISTLCLLFLIALLSAAARGISVECSCFGAAATEPLWLLIIRDVILFAGAVAIYIHLLLNELSSQKEGCTEMGVSNGTSRCLH